MQIQVKELQIYGKQSTYLKMGAQRYKQLMRRFADDQNGRCAMGAIMSIQGWDGRCLFSLVLEHFVYRNILHPNDDGKTFDEIIESLESQGK